MGSLPASSICERQTDISLAAAGLRFSSKHIVSSYEKNLDTRLAAIGSLLYGLYLADGYSLGKTHQDIGAWICCHSVWPAGGPGTKKHMGAYAYTKKRAVM